MGVTSIGWTDYTLNPITWRCAKVATECTNCYAETLTNRWQKPGAFTSGPPRLKPGRLLLPWTDPKMRAAFRVFLVSMSDPFHPGIPLDDQALIWAMMAVDPGHEYQVLTKRPHVMRKLLTRPDFPAQVAAAIPTLIGMLTPASGRLSPQRRAALASIERAAESIAWPLPNALLGVSAGTQDTANKFLPILRQTPAARRFVSAEPLIGRVDLDLTGIDWVIPGGESGAVNPADPFDAPEGSGFARPMDLAWLRRVVEQTHGRAAVFVKQLGTVQGRTLGLRDRKGEDMSEWPAELADLKIRQFPILERAA